MVAALPGRRPRVPALDGVRTGLGPSWNRVDPDQRLCWLLDAVSNGPGGHLSVTVRARTFSLVSSCQRHGHDPFAYLRDVLTRLLDQPKERLADLLPDRWTPPEATEATTGTAGLDVAEPVM
jgi:hypothetical protein